MRTRLASIALLVLALSSTDACAFGKKRSVSSDTVMDAVLADDATGLIEGCGAQPIVGFTYCRVVEGDAAEQALSFIGPPAKCNDPTSCVFIKVVAPGGSTAWGGSIPKGQTRVSVPWKTLLGADQFQLGNRGFWSFKTEVHWIDSDNHDRVSKSEGDIVLRVYKKGYTPLDKVSDDPNFVWRWIDGDFQYRMTSGLRAFVGKK